MRDDMMLLTVSETAGLLRISRNLAYELVTRGEIPAIRLGRVIRVPRAALDQWLEASLRGEPTGADASLPVASRQAGSGKVNGDVGTHRAQG